MSTDLEKLSSRWKIYSSLGYAVVILLVGLPMWWHTTTVIRAELPYEVIDSLSDTKTALTVNILLVSSDAQHDHILGPKIQSRLKDSTIYEFKLSSRALSLAEEGALKRSNSIEELDAYLENLQSKTLKGTIILFEIPSSSSLKLPSDNSILLGRSRTLYFQQRLQKYQFDALVKELVLVVREKMLGERAIKNLASSIQAPNLEIRTRWNLRRIISAPTFDLLFSLLVPEPEMLSEKWDIDRAIRQHLEPLLKELEEVASFKIKSQVLYLTGLSIDPKQTVTDDGNVFYAVSQEDLGLAINMESQLASHTSSLPAINFLAYVPTRSNSPLHVVSPENKIVSTNAFLLPRWGGVAIQNVKEKKINTDELMGIFVYQLRILLGLLDGTDESVEKTSFENLKVLEPGPTHLTVWEKEYLMRLFYVEAIYSSRVTLQSLSHLLSTISNIVISEEISGEIRHSVEDFVESAKFAENGQLVEAFELSKSSRSYAENAFFDKSLLALLYFPEDQKYAIYIPLFLPIAFSLFGSLLPLAQQVFSYLKKSPENSEKEHEQ